MKYVHLHQMSDATFRKESLFAKQSGRQPAELKSDQFICEVITTLFITAIHSCGLLNPLETSGNELWVGKKPYICPFFLKPKNSHMDVWDEWRKSSKKIRKKDGEMVRGNNTYRETENE